MSHNIASVSQAAFLPQQTGPGISAVQSQPSFGFEENDAFERRESLTELKKSTRYSGRKNRQTPLPIGLIIRRILRAIWSPIAGPCLNLGRSA